MVRLYADFSSDISWLGERIREDSLTIHDSLKPLAEHYLRKRSPFLSERDRPIESVERAHARPIPYITFWFAEAFGLTDREVTRRLALGVVYSALAFLVFDDIIDEESQSTSCNISLANMYLHRYLATFDGLFDPDSRFWHYLAGCIKELTQYLCWDFTFKHERRNVLIVDPFSEPFLKESIKSYSVLLMSSLAAIAFLTNNETKIPTLDKFWYNYGIGHRIYDDLNDWKGDLRMDDLNHSPILIYALQAAGGKSEPSEELIHSMLLDADFVEKVYSVMLGFLKEAREDASAFNCIYLSQFMDEQISFHTRNRDELLKTSSDFYRGLHRILDK